MRKIVVSKFGNEPDIFGNSLRVGMIGDWEVKKLLKALANDKENFITYYGKAKWDEQKAFKEFPNNNVQFIECQQTDDTNVIANMTDIDEFHILLGPHSFYNGGLNLPSWESIKTSLVTERLLERVAPQLKLMNAFPEAKCYFYLSDRRFLLHAMDLTNTRVKVLAQVMERAWYDRQMFWKDDVYGYKDYTFTKYITQKIEPFRFDMLWLLDKSGITFADNLDDDKWTKRNYNLVVSANQVVADSEIGASRLRKILGFTERLDDYTVVGKWTSEHAIKHFNASSVSEHYLDGLDIEEYNNVLKDSKFALVTFNTEDAPDMFVDNFITPKYWECVYNGCITFVEATEDMHTNNVIPEELQVFNGKGLASKIRKCLSNKEYRENLRYLQSSLITAEHFTGRYFTKEFNKLRGEW